ncbi:MAG: hydroxylamine reductase [Elusimicrobiaceae bacterium]|nr:hydroxylamine reductase [Elusimicrobiaceae bacterium]
MFCYQCQETSKNTGCTIAGACGKKNGTSDIQDLLIYTLMGMARYAYELPAPRDRKYGDFITAALFSTITNANFDDTALLRLVRQALALRAELARGLDGKLAGPAHDSMIWSAAGDAEMLAKAGTCGIMALSENPDLRSLKSLVLYGLKGISAYAHHAAVLGCVSDEIYDSVIKGLADCTRELPADTLTALVLETGKTAVSAMALLDKANTVTYGHPEITRVELSVRKNPGILISGHDLKDLHELLIQTRGTGVDVYTHSEMLPAHYYPAFRKFAHFAGNYGGSWWHQNKDFETFNGPVLMTTNCIIPVKDSYGNRIFTTGMTGYPGVKHIEDRQPGKTKDFSELIALAKTCAPPLELETGELVGGFAHNQVAALADKIVAAVKSGAIRRFVVMAGCDGRQPARGYFTEVARQLPPDTVILTAGCAKYRYNKLKLGDIGGIPRVLDAGQCNDSYSLAVTALALKDMFGLKDVNELPLSFDIAWYEQKAVAVLLALLALGFKGIRMGPTLPAFLSPQVAATLVEKFGIKLAGQAAEDVEKMMTGN